MRVRITYEALLSGDSGPRGITASQSIEASAIHYDMVRIEEAEHVAARVGTACDRIGGGFFQLAIQAAKVLPRVVDFEEYEDGVFSYEHLEWPNSQTLGRWLLDHIDSNALYQIAENWSMVGASVLFDVVAQWAASVDLPLTRGATVRIADMRQKQTPVAVDVPDLRKQLEHLQQRTLVVTDALLKATAPTVAR